MKTLYEWGTDYRTMWEWQKARQRELAEGAGEPLIMCTEHKPVYTLGRHGHAENMLCLPAGVECIRIDRGGDITYHGPGQLVVYPIVSLHELRLGVKAYVDTLEQAVIDTLARWGVKGERVEGATGVWIGKGTPRERKICAIGVRVSRGVTMHGLALCVSNPLEPFLAINPCGFTDKGVTTLHRELPGEVPAPGLREVAGVLAARLSELLTRHVRPE